MRKDGERRKMSEKWISEGGMNGRRMGKRRLEDSWGRVGGRKCKRKRGMEIRKEMERKQKKGGGKRTTVSKE